LLKIVSYREAGNGRRFTPTNADKKKRTQLGWVRLFGGLVTLRSCDFTKRTQFVACLQLK